jgi:hypothetical protein
MASAAAACASTPAQRLPIEDAHLYKLALNAVLSGSESEFHCVTLNGEDPPSSVLNGLGRGRRGQKVRAVPASACPHKDYAIPKLNGALERTAPDRASVSFLNPEPHWPYPGFCSLELARTNGVWRIVSNPQSAASGCSLVSEG